MSNKLKEHLLGKNMLNIYTDMDWRMSTDATSFDEKYDQPAEAWIQKHLSEKVTGRAGPFAEI